MNKIKNFAYLTVIVLVVSLAIGVAVKAFGETATISTVMENVTISSFFAGNGTATGDEELGAGNYPYHYGNLSVQGDLAVSGATSFTGATSLTSVDVTGAATLDTVLFEETTDRTIATGTTLTLAQSGTVFYLANSEGKGFTLPAVATATGTTYTFQVAAAFATSNWTVTSAEGDNIEGTLIVAGAVVDCDATDVVTFVADGENLGDYVTLVSDGQKWFVRDSGALTASKLTCSG